MLSSLRFQSCQWNTVVFIRSFVFFSAFPWGLRDVVAFYPPEGLQGLLGPNPVVLMGEGQGTPWMSHQLIAGPWLMAVAAPQGANCTSGAILGFSILLIDTSACSSVPPHPWWCHFKCVAMLDVFPQSYGFLVPQCLHTITVLSTNLFPSSLHLTGKPKCSHTGDLNDVPLLSMTTLHLTNVWTEHAHNFKCVPNRRYWSERITDQWLSIAPLATATEKQTQQHCSKPRVCS